MLSSSDAAIAVEGLRKNYGAVEAVRGITFTVRRGTTTALLGGNGAGKTTTLSMLLGVLRPTAGAIAVLGEDMLRHRHRVLPRMNFTSPYVDLPKRLTVQENLRVFADLYGLRRPNQRVADVAAQFDLLALLRRSYGSLSAGQRTRVSLAKALLNEPEVLLLDEPTAGMGHEDVGRVAELIKRVARGRTVLMVEHNLSVVADLCDTITVLARGSVLAEGTYAQVSADPAVREAYIGSAA
jgi:ABC-2 type transport system ATP-binding protein